VLRRSSSWDRNKGAGQAQGQAPKGRRGGGRKQRGGRRGEAGATSSPLAEGASTALNFQGHSSMLATKTRGSHWDPKAALQAENLTDFSSSLKGSHCLTGPEHAIHLGSSSAMTLTPMEQEIAAMQPDELKGLLSDICPKMEAAQRLHDKDKLYEAERMVVFESMTGRFAELAFHPNGCRFAQRAMNILDHMQQVKLAKELEGQVYKALESAHGNHVLQKCIELLPPACCGFMLAELAEDQCSQPSSALASHKYGCRVLERFIEHFPWDTLDQFLKPVIDSAKSLCMNSFGNFVIQHVLEHGTDEQKRSIVDMLKANLREMCLDNYACSVVGKALSYTEFQKELAYAIVEYEGLTVEMVMNKNGNGAFEATERLLKVLQFQEGGEEIFQKAKDQLMTRHSELQSSKNGKSIIKICAPDEFVEEPAALNLRTRTTSGSSAAGGRHPQDRRRHNKAWS